MAKKTPQGLIELSEAISLIVKETRIVHRMTQKELALAIGVDQALISRIEKAGFCNHSLTVLYKIFDVFNMDIILDFEEREQDD